MFYDLIGDDKIDYIKMIKEDMGNRTTIFFPQRCSSFQCIFLGW